MPTAIKDDLNRMKGRGPKNIIYATVIGEKALDRESGRAVSMESWCPSFVVYTAGVGYAKGTDQDSEAILKFWRANAKAPKTYKWTEGGKPPLVIPAVEPTYTTIIRTEEDL